MPSETPDFVLIACSGTKAADVDEDVSRDDVLAVGDQYRGQAFKKSREYAEKNGAGWAVLSGKYGVLTPSDRIPYYEKPVQDRDPEEWREQVLEGLVEIDALLRPGADVLVLAPTPYVDPIRDVLDDGLPIEWEAPLEGLRQGEMLSALNDLLEDVDGVQCNGCGRYFPEDPVMAVSCPTCPAEPGQKCKRPSGWSGPFTHPHTSRDHMAIAMGVAPGCPAGDDPETPQEAAEKLDVECPIDDPANPYAYRWPGDTAGVADVDPVPEPDLEGAEEDVQELPETINGWERSHLAHSCVRYEDREIRAKAEFFAHQGGVDVKVSPPSDSQNVTVTTEPDREAAIGALLGIVTEYAPADVAQLLEGAEEDVDAEADGAAAATVCDGGQPALEGDDVHYDPTYCLAITGAGGEQCNSGMTPVCGNHEKSNSLVRVDEFEEGPDGDLRDELMDHCEFPGQRAYAMAVLADDVEEVWQIVTGLQDVSVGPNDWSASQLASWADKVAMHPDLDVDWSHPLAAQNCVGITGKGEQCPNGSYSTRLLCGMHQDMEEYPETVLERDGILDELRQVRIDDGVHYVVEERGDDVVVITPEWELERVDSARIASEVTDDPEGSLREEFDVQEFDTEDSTEDVGQPDPYDPATYDIEEKVHNDPDGPDIAGWELNQITFGAPSWKNGDGEYARVTNQAGKYRAFTPDGDLKFGGSDLEGAIEAVVDWLKENPYEPVTYESLDLERGDVVRITDVPTESGPEYLVTSTPENNDSLDERDVYIVCLQTEHRGAVRVERIDEVLVRADENSDRPEVLEGIEEGDTVAFEIDAQVDDIWAEAYGGVVDVGSGGWEVPEGGAAVTIYVEIPDDLDDMVVLEAMRDAKGEWSEVEVAALDEDLHRTDYGVLVSIDVVDEDELGTDATNSTTSDVKQQEDDEMFNEEVHEVRSRQLQEQTSLTERQADVVAAKELGLSHPEIAEFLGISKGSVDSHSSRAKRKFNEAEAEIEEAEARIREAKEILEELGDVYGDD